MGMTLKYYKNRSINAVNSHQNLNPYRGNFGGVQAVRKGGTHSNLYFVNFSMSTPQDNIIEKLESEIERLKLEIFELKGELKITKGQLKEATIELQKQQGYYDDDGNYVE